MGDGAGGLLGERSVWIAMPSVATFTDREEYLTRIGDFADRPRDTPGLVVLRGATGIGKTALLAHLAMKFRGKFRHALTLDLSNHSTGTKSRMDDVFALALEGLGVDRSCIPTDSQRLKSRYLDLTEGHRLLLILDGVTSASQVLALRPNSGLALVLVGAEAPLNDLADIGGVFYDVKGFSPSHGAQYLSRICPDRGIDAERAHAERLSVFCGGNPLALRLAAGSLRAHRRGSVADVVAELERDLNLEPPAHRRLHVSKELTRTLTAAFDRLSPDGARLYRLFGALPGREFPEQVVAAAFGVRVDELWPVIEPLVEQGLVEEPAQGEYRVLDVVRLHSRQVAAWEDSQDAAVAEAIGAWVALAAAADRGVREDRFRVGEEVPGTDRIPVGMAWFVRWHGSLLEVMREAYARELDSAVWRIFEAMWPFYTDHSFLQAWSEAGRMAVASANRCGDTRAEARVSSLYSRPLRLAGKLADARKCADRALELARELEDEVSLAAALDLSGHCSLAEEDYSRALEEFQQSLAINERIGDRRGIALQTQFAGRALVGLGRIDDAVEAFERARGLVASFEKPDHRTAAKIAFSMGAAHYAAGRRDDAAVYATEAVAEGENLGETMVLAEPLALLATIAKETGDEATETGIARRLVDLHRRAGSEEVVRWRSRLAELTGDHD